MRTAHILKILCIFTIFIVNGYDADKIDSKLDLEETKEFTSSAKPTVAANSSSINANTKTLSPEIHGLRVTVDTSGITSIKNTKEFDSNENIEVVNRKKSRKIGIHTDITFEITGSSDNKYDINATNVNSDENDASVPIFEGRDYKLTTTTNKSKPKKPFNPQDQPPQWPTTYRSDTDRFYSQFNPTHPSVFTKTIGGATIYRSIDNWSNFKPITSVWTTERTYLYYPVVSRSHTNLADIKNHQNAVPYSSHRVLLQKQAKPSQGERCYYLSDI